MNFISCKIVKLDYIFCYSCILVFNQLKQPVVRNIFENTDFTGDESLPFCLAHHMSRRELIGVADTRLLWKIDFEGKCNDRKCPINILVSFRGYFKVLVKQDFLICPDDGQGWTWTRESDQILSESDISSTDSAEETFCNMCCNNFCNII